MKVGILTYHRSMNYGALLQAYALQTFIKELGYDVSIIDYWPDYHEAMYNPFKEFRKYNIKRKTKYIINFLFTFFRTQKRRKKHEDFIKEFLHLSKESQYDVVVYGSDQIWRKQHRAVYNYFNPVYFGNDYINSKFKITYAASMGHIEIDSEKDKNFLLESFENFNAISLREQDLKEYIKKEFNKEYKLVLDPVFLLEKSQWMELISPRRIPKKKYILYYRLQGLKEADQVVKELAKETGLSVIEMRVGIPLFHYGKKYRLTANAQEFISLLSKAECVVSTSFHGVALSICFERQFIYLSQDNRKNRVQSLLSMLGLTDRILDLNNPIFDYSNLIEYEKIQPKLIELKNDSKKWLSGQLKIFADTLNNLKEG